MQFIHYNAKHNVSSVISHFFVLVRTLFDVALIWTGPVELECMFTRPVLDLQCAPELCLKPGFGCSDETFV